MSNSRRTLCIHELFEEQVEQNPNAIALTLNDSRLSYRDLNNRANQLANHLRERGAKAEVLIAVYMDRSIELVVSLLAILKSGSAYLPLDLATPIERVDFILKESNAKFSPKNICSTIFLIIRSTYWR